MCIQNIITLTSFCILLYPWNINIKKILYNNIGYVKGFLSKHSKCKVNNGQFTL